jgi:hypothetical protein
VTIPVDQLLFLKTAVAYSVALFTLVWVLSTFRATLSGTYVMVGLTFLVLWSFAGILATAFLNKRFDISPPERHLVQVFRKFTTSSGMGPLMKSSGLHTSHRAVVASWRSEGEETISVTPAIYSRIEPNTTLDLTVHRGALQMEWIEAVRIAKAS